MLLKYSLELLYVASLVGIEQIEQPLGKTVDLGTCLVLGHLSTKGSFVVLSCHECSDIDSDIDYILNTPFIDGVACIIADNNKSCYSSIFIYNRNNIVKSY